MNINGGLNPSLANDGPYRLFVNGIPSRVAPIAVYDYFSFYGRVKMQRLGPGNSLTTVLPAKAHVNTRRGFCVLLAEDQQTLESILSRSHEFMGRTLGVNRFRQGQELFAYFNKISSRRVIIKRVPTTVSVEDVQSLLENLFGSVERIYRFEAESLDKAARKEKRRRTFTYSVEFHLSQDAEKAVNLGEITFEDGVKAIIEKYSRQSNKQQTSSKSPQSNLSSEIYNHNVNTKRSPKQFTKDSPLSGATASRSISAGKVGLDLYTADLSTDGSEIEHQVKPTARQYFTQQVYAGNPKLGTISPIRTSEANVRFNYINPRLRNPNESTECYLQNNDCLRVTIPVSQSYYMWSC